MARYSQTFKAKAVARLLPPEGATLDEVSRELGVRIRWPTICPTRAAKPPATDSVLAVPAAIPGCRYNDWNS
jgi:hypothetical protein